MSVFKKILGITGSIFKLGIGATSHAVVDNADGVAITNNDGSTPANAVIARPQGANANTHAATYLDLKERAFDIAFSFAGGSPPAAGANTGLYGMCSTSGGSYSAGCVYLDNGVALVLVTVFDGYLATPRASFTGTVAMSQDDIYIAQSSVAPYTWTKKGGEAHIAGMMDSIEVDFTYSSMGGTVNSTATVPDGCKVLGVYLQVTTPFTGGSAPTAAVAIHGVGDTALISSTDNNLATATQYDVEDLTAITTGNGGPVRITLGGTATAGAGKVTVQYVTPAT